MSLQLLVYHNNSAVFFPLFVHGVELNLQTGGTLQELLCEQLGIPPRILEDRLQTIMLNGKAVDDPGNIIVEPNDTLALSAAMPGLAGAIMRKKGRYYVLRSQINLSRNSREPRDSPVMKNRITIKLFNLIIRELGPQLLDRGVFVKTANLQEMFQKRCFSIKKDCSQVFLNKKRIVLKKFGFKQIMEKIKKQEYIFLQVKT